MRRTKIICTLGPAVNSVEKIKNLILSGMDCARLNFSHGTLKSHKEILDKFSFERFSTSIITYIENDFKKQK